MKKLNAPRFKEASYERTVYVATPEAGVTLDEIQKPEFWSHVAAKLKPYDMIEARAEDGSYWAQLLVINCNHLSAHVALLQSCDLNVGEPDQDDAAGSDYEVKWGGPHAKHRVQRKSDGEVLKDGFANKQAATKYLTEHLRALAA